MNIITCGQERVPILDMFSPDKLAKGLKGLALISILLTRIACPSFTYLVKISILLSISVNFCSANVVYMYVYVYAMEPRHQIYSPMQTPLTQSFPESGLQRFVIPQ